MSLAPWRQLLAQQELAARVAHMSAGNILFAQYSLDASLTSLGAEHPAATSIASAQTALREALASLDRTRFFGVPWNQRGQCVRIGPFIAALGAELNAQVRCALAKTTLKACRSERQLRVRASTERLRCALRDALLATWLLRAHRGNGWSDGRGLAWPAPSADDHVYLAPGMKATAASSSPAYWPPKRFVIVSSDLGIAGARRGSLGQHFPGVRCEERTAAELGRLAPVIGGTDWLLATEEVPTHKVGGEPVSQFADRSGWDAAAGWVQRRSQGGLRRAIVITNTSR